jgi:hypothetical protein
MFTNSSGTNDKGSRVETQCQVMKVDIAGGVKLLVLRNNSTCCGQTGVLTADERTIGGGQLFKSGEAIVVRRHRDETGTLVSTQ